MNRITLRPGKLPPETRLLPDHEQFTLLLGFLNRAMGGLENEISATPKVEDARCSLRTLVSRVTGPSLGGIASKSSSANIVSIAGAAKREPCGFAYGLTDSL
jgi:hypothetical protein